MDRISLGKRLRLCPSFRCFGVAPNWDDYPAAVREAIRNAEEIFYPSPLYETIFESVGKAVHPGSYYGFAGNKIRQTLLFQLLGISHPRTHVYYGRNRAEKVLRDFQYPFLGKTPVASSRGEGVYLIEDAAGLDSYVRVHLPAYIQEYLPIDRDLRAVVINGEVVHSYWRVHRPGEFRNNVARGASIHCDCTPPEALEFARDVAVRCGFGEAGLDICFAHGRYYVLEANMVYGLEGFRRKGLDPLELMMQMDNEGKL